MSRKRNLKIRQPLKFNDFATGLAEEMKGTAPVLILGYGEGVGFHAISRMNAEMEMAAIHYLIQNCARYRGMTEEEYVFKLMRKYNEESKNSKESD